MSDTTSTHYYKVKYSQAIENYRKISLESLHCDYKPDLKSISEIRLFTHDMNVFVSELLGLTKVHSEDRFNHFRTMCRDGWTAVFMPEVVFEIEGLSKDAEVYVLVFSEDGSIMGTLTYDDLNF